jgi:isoleucyl-tRNA synthetase
MAEEIYRNLTKEESVHLSDWPEVISEVKEELIDEMKKAREIVEKVHAERKMAKIPVRQPLAKFESNAPFEIKDVGIISLVNGEVNVKEWIQKKGTEVKVKLDTKITPELEEEAKARELIRKIQEERRNLGMNLTQKVSVSAPWVPTDTKLVQRVKNKTLTESLKTGEFKVAPF